MTLADSKTSDTVADMLALDEAWQLGCTGRSILALEISLSVHEACSLKNDQFLTARAAQDTAWYCFQLGKPEMGLIYAEQAVSLWCHLERPQFHAQALSIHAWLHLELGRMEEAVALAAEALDIADQSGDARSRSLAINITGVIFWLSRQPPLAIDYCGRAVALAREAGDKSFECWWLINLGGSHAEAAYLCLEAGDRAAFDICIAPAIAVTEIAYSLARSLGDGWAERLCLGNLAEYSNAAEDFTDAERFLAQFRAITSEENARGEAHYLDILGRTLVSLKRYEEALVPLHQAYALATENSNVETLMFACLYLSKAHEYLGAFEPALDFHKRYHSLHQQFTAERTQHNARLADIRYETKKLKALLDTESERTAMIARSLEALQQQTTMLAQAANTDPLTGLFNRRRLEAVLNGLSVSGERYAHAVLDVDHFKAINDTYSHMIGDRVLMQLAVFIKDASRGTHLAVRFGGEEFVLLMTGVTIAQAKRACEQVRLKTARHDWSSIAKGLAVTVSIGVALSSEADHPDAVLALADGKLYRAKQTGRNRVVACCPTAQVHR